MCYNISLDVGVKALEARYYRVMLEDTRRLSLPYHNISAFTHPWWPVISTEDRYRILVKQWGLVPEFARNDPKSFLAQSPTFNAISEEAAGRSAFRDAWKEGRRCLIPVTHFREWKLTAVPGRKAATKMPYDIWHTHERPFSLAGLWEGETFTILTRPANELVARINNTERLMPVVIPRAFEGDWLSSHLESEDILRHCRSLEGVDLEATAA